VVAQAREQLSHATLRSRITGIVTQRITEVGNLVQPNGEILRIGDFSRVQVDVEVSELQRANIRVGQSVSTLMPTQIKFLEGKSVAFPSSTNSLAWYQLR